MPRGERDRKKSGRRRGGSAPDVCEASGKCRFRDHAQAVAALHQAARSRQMAAEFGFQSRRAEVRCYACDACQGWHLTSQPAAPLPVETVHEVVESAWNALWAEVTDGMDASRTDVTAT